MFGYIYITTNLINNKKYIGKRKSSRFLRLYFGSGIGIKNAIAKYGKENFKVELLEEIHDFIDVKAGIKYLAEREMFYINKYNAVKSNEFYNMSYGGENEGWYGVNKAKKVNPDYYKYHHWKYTKNYSPKNRKYSEEEIEKFKSNHWKTKGLSVWNKGLKIPIEKQTEQQKNWKNVCKGRVWINKDNKSKRILKEELETYLNLGWKKGRKK